MGNNMKENEPGNEELTPKERLDKVKEKMKAAEAKGAQLAQRHDELVESRKELEEKIKARKEQKPAPEDPVTRT
ncbi:MAG TPA: hypothetical protein PKL29_00030 [Methanothrix sp.]|nr:hypothetical protein [Methanothrix sp.]HPT36697.1 hypothetical protein [Methanothrix sp.]